MTQPTLRPSHRRLLLAGTLIFAAGRGSYAAFSVVYFTRALGLSVPQVGILFSVAGIVGIASSVAFGHVVDRIGARTTVVLSHGTQALLIAALTLAHSFVTALVIVAALGATDKGIQVARLALVSHLAGEQERVRLQAYVRTAFNVGASVGALSAGPVIAANAGLPYRVLVLAIAACHAVVAVASARLPNVSRLSQRADAPHGPRPGRSYLALGLVNGVLALHVSILEVALPLWILEHTRAPAFMVSVLVFANTVLAVLLQVTASRWAGSVRGAARTLGASAVLSALSCLLLAGSAGLGAAPAVVLLVAGVVALTMGELLQSAGAWGVSFGLAPARAQGRYLGVFSVGAALQDAFGPVLIAIVVIAHPPIGWLVLAAAIAAAGAAAPPLATAASTPAKRPVAA